jgi:soluble lytic murein transglycosylase-like protein
MLTQRAILVAALLASPAALAAEVLIEVRADGTQVIRNEAPAARERRLSARLLAAPTQRIAELIERYAGEHDVDPRLVQAVMQAESGYNVKALSTKGAIGLMQLMPQTARELAVGDPWDPEQNVRGGVAYLKRMLDLFSQELDFALAAYNAGPNAVLQYAGVPPYAETRHYVRKVRCLYDGDCSEAAQMVGGRKVRIVRDGQGGIILTTSGPGG